MIHLPANLYLMAFVFCAALCSYNFHYTAGSVFAKQQFNPGRLSGRGANIFFLLSGIAAMIIIFPHTQLTAGNIALAFALTFLYSVPLLPFKQLAFTRRAGFIKTVLLAFTWMFVTAYLPLSQYGIELTTTGLLIMLKRFLFMLMLCIIFDSRDAAVDTISGLHSLVTDLRPEVMRWLIYILFTALFVLNFFLGKHGITVPQRISLQITSIATLIVYFFSTKKQDYFFYYFIVDGLMILSALLMTVASI